MNECPYCGHPLKPIHKFSRGPPPTSITQRCKKCKKEVVFEITKATIIGTKGRIAMDIPQEE